VHACGADSVWNELRGTGSIDWVWNESRGAVTDHDSQWTSAGIAPWY
jgi:hypothetical protein